MSIKEILDRIKSFFNGFVGDHELPSEENDAANAKAVIIEAMKSGNLSEAEGKAAIDALERVDNSGKDLEGKIAGSVQLYRGDIDDLTVKETPKAAGGASGGKGIKAKGENEIVRDERE